MDKQEIKRYLLIECKLESEVHDFLLNWRDLGYFEVEHGVIINSTEDTILDDLLDIADDVEYGILIPLSDCEVIARGYFILGEEDLVERMILPLKLGMGKKETEDLEPTGE